MLVFRIYSKDPQAHIEVCSFISYFMAEIIDAGILETEEYFGFFKVKGTPDFFDILSDYSENIILEITRDLP